MPEEGVSVRLVEAPLFGTDGSGMDQLRHIPLDLPRRAAQIETQGLAGGEADAVYASIAGQPRPEQLGAARKAAVGQDRIRHENTGAKLAVWNELLARNH